MANVNTDETVGNPRSQEEEEELEEQRRRQKELDHLLSDGIQAFNYDDNSPNTTTNMSIASYDDNRPNYLDIFNNHSVPEYNGKQANDCYEQNDSYREAMPHEQLKVLYEVRIREINNLTNEFNRYKTEISEEIKLLKKKLILSEAEIKQLQLSLSNNQNLLVEKTSINKSLKESLQEKDTAIANFQKQIEEDKIEICAYKSTINELQLKISDNNPFNSTSRNFKSDELQRAHKEQILKLEMLLEEQTTKTQNLEKDYFNIEHNLKDLIRDKNETDTENNVTIMGLSKKLQTAQQQCRDLFCLGEALKKESDHFKERLRQLECNTTQNYDSFRAKSMDNESLLVHLEKFKRMLLDKDIELNTLKSKLKFYNDDLCEFFEYKNLTTEMDIKPCGIKEHENQLLFLRKELRYYQQLADDHNEQILNLNLVNKELEEKIEEMLLQTRTDIQNLSDKYSLPQLEVMSNDLKNAEERASELQQLLEKLTDEKHNLIKKADLLCSEKEKYENLFNNIKKDLERTENENTTLRKSIDDLKIENNTLQFEKCNKDQNQYVDLLQKFEKSEEQIRKLGDTVEELMKIKNSLENEKMSLDLKQKSCLNELEDYKNEIAQLNDEFEVKTNNFKEQLLKLESELKECKISLKISEETRFLLEEQLKKHKETDSTKNIQYDLNNVADSDLFQNCLQTELLKNELNLRDVLQKENSQKLKKIEETYQNICMDKSKEVETLKAQESQYRKQLAFILAQCGEKVTQFEAENTSLQLQNDKIIHEFESYKQNMSILEKQYENAVLQIKKDYDNLTTNYLKKEKSNYDKITQILQRIKQNDKQIELIKNTYDKRINKLKPKIL